MIGALHLAAWLLLTAGARSRVATLEAAHGRAALAGAMDPGPQPPPGPEMAAWVRDRGRWEDAEAWAQQAGVARALGLGLLVSFLVQAGILGMLLARAVAARGPRRGHRA